MKKKFFIAIIILIVVIGLIYFYKSREIVKPDTNYVATIYHSEMIGADAGTEYIYYIYPNKDNNYTYIKSKADVTVTGSGEQKDIDSGIIKKETDFEKIEKDIENDKLKNAQQYISYTFINNGKTEECNSINELINKLF